MSVNATKGLLARTNMKNIDGHRFWPMCWEGGQKRFPGIPSNDGRLASGWWNCRDCFQVPKPNTESEPDGQMGVDRS